MGSTISTIIMFSHNVFIVCSIFIHGTSALKWVKTTGAELPVGSAKVYPNTKTPHYFCRVQLESGGMSYGQLTDSSPDCVYPDNDNKVGTAEEYDILVTEEDSLDWVYGTHPTTQAVTCSLEVGTEADCYLGQGVYSDGICVEALGYIRPSERNIYMTAHGKVETCPAYLFLIVDKKTEL